MKKLFNFRLLVLIGVLIMSVSQMWAGTRRIYFDKSDVSWWNNDSHKSCVYAWINDDDKTKYEMTNITSTNIFYADIDDKYSKIIFYRSTSKDGSWTNQSVDITIDGYKNYFLLKNEDDNGKKKLNFQSFHLQDAYLYFDKSKCTSWGTGSNHVIFTIGRYDYTDDGYTMTNISNTYLYQCHMQGWTNYDRYRFVNTTSYTKHNSAMSETPSVAGYTAITSGSSNSAVAFDNSSNNISYSLYTFNGTNGTATTKTERTAYTDFNYTQTIETYVKDGTGSYTKANSKASITTRSYVLTSATGSGNSSNPTLSTSASEVTFSAAHSADTRLVCDNSVAANYEFVCWNKGETDETSSKTFDYRPTGATTIKAYFAHTYTVTVGADANGSSTNSGDQTVGQVGLEITASPTNSGEYVFDRWEVTGGASVTSTTSATTTVTATADGTVTAIFRPRFELHGEKYTGGTEGMPGWDPTTSAFTYANSEWSFTTDDLTKTTKYKFKLYDRATGSHMGLDAETEFTNGVKGIKAFSTSNEQQGWFTTTFGGPYKFVLDITNMNITITFNSKALPDYSGKSITQALNSAASGYVIGSGTIDSHYKIYASTASDHGKVDLTMDYSDVSTAHDAIYYSVDGVETGVMEESESEATATMSMSTSAGNYSPAIKAYGKVDDQYNLSYAANLSTTNLYYDVIATPTLEIALKNSSDVAITSSAGLEVGQSIKIVPTLSGAIRDGSYVTYSYRISGSSDAWTTIATTQATNSAYTWSSNLPTEPNIYTIKATYEDLGITVEATQDIVYWKDFTIYVWETGQDLATANQNANKVHEYYKNNQYDTGDPARKEHEWASSKALTDKSTDWGGGWHSFSLKWPLYNYFIINYNASSDDNKQSKSYYLGTKPENLYLQCNYSSSGKWTWGGSAISEPEAPSITITAVNVYATKLVVDIAYNNHYSLLTAKSLTVNGDAKDITGSVTNVGGGTYRCTLTGLEENTDYMFRASATNALGTANEALNITTLAKAPFTMTIKVSSGLMANVTNYWGDNGKTTVKIKYWNDDAGFEGVAELTKLREYGGYFWYKYTIEDSPASFYVFNANCNDGNGSNRSANWNNQSSDGCAEVYNSTGEYDNHTIGSPALCGVHYKLEYYNGRTTTTSNIIGDPSDKMSMFLGAYNDGSPAGRWLKLYKFDTGWDGGTPISLEDLDLADSAVYVISFIGENFDTSTGVSDWKFEKYTGDYYIRTDHAPGGWNNYKGNSNKMTYSDYAAHVSGSTFDHYFCKWVQGNDDAGRNVKFDVANDYNNSLASGNDGFAEDDFANSVGQLKQNANVRFMYDSRTNKMSRAYLSGSSSASDRFLILRGNSSNKLYKVTDTNEKGDEYSTDSQLDWALFKDNNNWIYQLDVFAKPGTKIKLTARFKDKSNINRTQSFLGEAVAETVGDDTFTDSNTELLIGGSGETFYQMRVIYDFKTNRLMTAWIPTELGSELAIHADVMLVREGQGDAQQITLNNHDLKNVHTVYAVMQFNRWKLNNRANPNLQTVASCAREVSANNWVYDETVTNRPENHPALTEEDDGWLTQYERDLYWISFPFDVNLNEVFGSVGTYGTHWIIEYYDGKGRAQNGFWADSPSNWKFITNVNTTLKAYEGYILALDLDYFAYNNTTMWANNIHQVELYFPSSSSETSPIKITTNKLDVEFKDQSDYQCHIDRRTDKTTPNTDKDRRVVDSYWHCIGTPSFHDIDTIMHTIDENPTNPGAGGNIPVPTAGTYWEPEGKMFLYKWNKDNTLSVITSGSEQTFKSMWSYMVQYSGSKLTWHSVSQVAPNSVAARVQEFPDREFCLKITRDSIEEDHTYVRLTDDANVTNAFEFNYDLCKEQNGGKANIWTVTTDVIPVAGNSMPKPVQTTVVPVGVKVVTGGEYTLAMPEGTNGEDVYLIDNAYGTRTNLGLMPYTVTLTAGTYDSRFALEFGPIQDAPTGIEQMSTINYQLSTEEVRKVFVGGRLYIIRDGKVYDAAGQRVE